MTKVSLVNDKEDFACEITDQTAMAIMVKIPAKATSGMRLT